MARAVSFRRYSQAIFEIALETNRLDGWIENLREFSVVLSDPEVSGLLKAPQIPTESKVRMINELFGDSVDELAQNFLLLLATRNLIFILPEISREFSKLVDEQAGIARGELISAVNLDKQQRDDITQVLSDIVGKPVKLTSSVDSGITGGIVARIGDRVIDGSVRAKFREMRRMMANQVL